MHSPSRFVGVLLSDYMGFRGPQNNPPFFARVWNQLKDREVVHMEIKTPALLLIKLILENVDSLVLLASKNQSDLRIQLRHYYTTTGILM